MSKEHQILQLRAKGYSQRRIADTLKVSRNTVAKVFNAMETRPVAEIDLTSITDQELHQRLFRELRIINNNRKNDELEQIKFKNLSYNK